ncbi:MAG TPA: hypothetical protein VM802_15170 [Chitinophaga sp.]|uniref:nuclear transport factor 2 family protein n=1 Tax=Chitinophaga sp. TaxID=1869181 RepID=UPI002CF424D0|nr:hypothetical protein [Chitinophaga sp.]HVI46215.1 hypothetical protein [Chitinophaga sp.]
MSTTSATIDIVKKIYDNPGDPSVFREVLAPDASWTIVHGFPYSGTYIGSESLLNDFFAYLLGNVLDEIIPFPEVYFEINEYVIVTGFYKGRAKTTGLTFTASFTHIYKLEKEKIVTFQQCADTVQIARALKTLEIIV